MKSDRLITTARQFKKLMLDDSVHTIKVYPDGSDVPKVFHVERRGRWIADEHKPLKEMCSVCGFAQFQSRIKNFCPNCGARMEAD